MNASTRAAVLGSLGLLVLFAAGSIVGRALALPVPATVVGLGLALLGLRLAVMAASIREPAEPPRPAGSDADTRGSAVHAANG
jgi:putative effector of murein hydrolase LrgA (UPF0299 family)